MTDGREVVQAQYETWVYPLPVPDIAEAIQEGSYETADPSLIRRKLWPRKVEPDALEILVAGCGSNQAAHLAFTNRACHVVGIDISETSLDHQRLLKEKHELDNLELHQLPVEQVGDLRQSFDLIVSTGVLHHLPDPDKGVRSLRDVLAPHGVMHLMLYGRYGRLGIYMLQEALRLLGAEQDEDGLEMVRHVLETVPDWHPIVHYLEVATDLGYDAGLVDTFLHRVDRPYTVPEVYQLVSHNGLKFQAWLDNVAQSVSAHIPEEDDPLRRRAEQLDEMERSELLELLWQEPTTQRFLVCHPERPESDYVLDFSGEAWLGYVPSLRPPIDIIVSQKMMSGSVDDDPVGASVQLVRPSHSVQLNRVGAAALELVDGVRSTAQIINGTAEIRAAAGLDEAEHVEAARLFFQQMAEWDHFMFEIP